MNNKMIRLLSVALFSGLMSYAQDTIMPIWSGEIPNRIASSEIELVEKGDILKISKVQIPALEVYLPAKANSNGQAVLIFPGGGYHILAYDWEGTDIAKYLNSKGIAGIVVKYRLPTSESVTDPHNVPLIDAQRAIRMVRYNADKWNLDAGKIGIMGFSAGGHLASTLGTHFQEEVYPRREPLDMLSARPDFMILVYPVITFTKTTVHQGSRVALLGAQPGEDLVRHFSNELQVTKDTPPAILIHAADDQAVPAENSILFFQALQSQGVPAALHIYPEGGHGFSLSPKDPYLRGWTERVTEWLETINN